MDSEAGRVIRLRFRAGRNCRLRRCRKAV